MDCTRCSGKDYNKAGIVKGRQRYKCKCCGYHYSVAQRSGVKPRETRKLALQMYLEGLGFRSIGRILGISHVTVYNWVAERGGKASLPRSGEPVEIVELDEMHSYVGQKKTTVGYGLLLIDLENGSSILSVGTAPRRPSPSSGTD